MRFTHLTGPTQLLTWAGNLVRQLERDAAELRQQGDMTLAVSPATETSVKASGARVGGRVFLQPRTATAVAAGAYVSAVADGAFTVTHDAAADTDRDFWYSIHV